MKDFYVKVYLTNLGKYVEGYLVGKWVDVTKCAVKPRALALGI